MTNKGKSGCYSTCGDWKDHEEHSGEPTAACSGSAVVLRLVEAITILSSQNHQELRAFQE